MRRRAPYSSDSVPESARREAVRPAGLNAPAAGDTQDRQGGQTQRQRATEQEVHAELFFLAMGAVLLIMVLWSGLPGQGVFDWLGWGPAGALQGEASAHKVEATMLSVRISLEEAYTGAEKRVRGRARLGMPRPASSTSRGFPDGLRACPSKVHSR